MIDYIIGKNSVLEILKSDHQINKLCILKERKDNKLRDIYKIAKEKNILIQELPLVTLDRLANKEKHQGVIVYIAPIQFADLDEVIEKAFFEKENPLFILLDKIEDVQNLGAIIRTAECAGVDAILLPKHNSAPVNNTVAKTSAGAISYVNLVKIGNTLQTINKLKKKNFWVIGADVQGKENMFNLSLKAPTLLIIGNESKGISKLVKENCDILVKIPMFGQINSLNASVAAGLLIYEIIRK